MAFRGSLLTFRVTTQGAPYKSAVHFFNQSNLFKAPAKRLFILLIL